MISSEKRGLIEIQNVQVTFERWGNRIHALNCLSIMVPAGQWLMLVGPNGSGKSTILKVLSGRLKQDRGVAQIDGNDVTGMDARQLSNAVFLVHQDPLLGSAPLLTVYENLLVADTETGSNRLGKKALYEKYSELLLPSGLSTRLKQPVKTLSGGERQLLALLIAGLRPSSVILLDEPLAALDPEKTEQCIEQIRALHRQGKTIIQVTHDEELTASLGDRTVALRNGMVVFDETGLQERKTVHSRHLSGE